MKARQVVKLVEKAGWVFVNQEGSHMKFRHLDFKYPLIIPNHGSRDLKKGTLLKILRDAGLR